MNDVTGVENVLNKQKFAIKGVFDVLMHVPPEDYYEY
jgi:hypothetical protein